ncbi:MAG: DUF4965 domain-containing protein [Alistipes sp.]|nr:DUF4965 domain-containing protein [Alistipes sp.]
MSDKFLFLILLAGTVSGCSQASGVGGEVIPSELRAPAYPLVTIDPYTSAWSMADNLYDESVKHWTGRDFPLIGVLKVDGEAYRFMGAENIPVEAVIRTGEQAGSWPGVYTTDQPAADWMEPGFDDSGWQAGQGAFGTMENEPTARTQWSTDHIWVRRSFDLPEQLTGRVFLEYSHDDRAVIYVNGIQVVDTGDRTGKGRRARLSDEVLATLKPGRNVIAGYCNNPQGNGLLDFGIFRQKDNYEILTNTAKQISADVQATQTHYVFECGPVELKVSFAAPSFMEDLDLLSRPVNYLTYEVTSKDGQAHQTEIYFEAASNWALDSPLQTSTIETVENNGLVLLRTGSEQQSILAKRGDDLRIDWGYFYMAGDKKKFDFAVGEAADLRRGFVEGGLQTGNAGLFSGSENVFALTGCLGKGKSASGYIMLGYDDIYSIQYFGDNLRPYWNRNGDKDIFSQFAAASRDYRKLIEQCYQFDRELMEAAMAAGGRKYAELCALAYRQAIAAHKLVQAPNGDLLWLSKENNSNGSIGTVDITYPSAPLFLYYNPELVKGLMNHIFYYSESGKWTKPFPAHDVGTYPLANGQTYGGDMPIEEAGNMLTLVAAITMAEGNADYAARHWDVLTVWTDYLVEYGLDPENQLCTDDFAGHFAHNVNLSAKAIMGIASYGYVAGVLGKETAADFYTAKAREMARMWMQMADDGDHYRLTFDKPGTWSQKYNIVWDKLLGLGIFPDDVAVTEVAYYLTKQNRYGLPLDNRMEYTKTDWIIWSATLAQDKQTFEKFIDPMWDFMNETTDRVPMSDWIWTDKPLHRGFKARAVVGGYWIKMLEGNIGK